MDSTSGQPFSNSTQYWAAVGLMVRMTLAPTLRPARSASSNSLIGVSSGFACPGGSGSCVPNKRVNLTRLARRTMVGEAARMLRAQRYAQRVGAAAGG